MLLQILGVTVGAGLLDSLNPIAIAQQFILQSVTERRHDILAYIFGIGLTNFIFGLLFYFGLAQLLRGMFESIQANCPLVLPMGAIIAGLSLLIYTFYQAYKLWQVKNSEAVEAATTEQALPDRKLSIIQLFGIGVVSCLAELTSALPYIGYLTYLISQDIHWNLSLTMLILYNLFLFNLPLYLLYGLSLRYEAYLSKIYVRFQLGVRFVLDKVLPVVLIILGIYLIHYGLINI